MIKAEIIADSFCNTRLTTFLVTAPRIILAEINTHTIIPKNSASSRAIPVEKRIQQVLESPYIPMHMGRNKRGMQTDELLTEDETLKAKSAWVTAATNAAHSARQLANIGLHKQEANRVLEPYVYCSTILSGTEWANFFNLRINEAAQASFCELAGQMLEAYLASTPVILKPGEWHYPFHLHMPDHLSTNDKLQVSTARCARLSYEAHDRRGVDDKTIEDDLALFQKLHGEGHASPYQHQAQAVDKNNWCTCCRLDWGDECAYSVMSDRLIAEKAMWDGTDVWWAQFRWWKMYRKTLPNENQGKMDPQALLATLNRLREERGIRR